MKSFYSCTSVFCLLTWTSMVASAFVPHAVPFLKSSTSSSPRPRKPTRIFLEDRIADLIDGEAFRQNHLKDFENEWMEKNREAVLFHFNDDQQGGMLGGGNDDAQQDLRQLKKDRRLAESNPQQYCADRCVATGNCDVYEDIFDFSPQEVMSFCTDCVLSDEDEPCDIPDAFYDMDELKP